MSLEENKAIARRFIEEVDNKGNLAVIDELVATNFVDHNPLPGLPSGGIEGVKQVSMLCRCHNSLECVTRHKKGLPQFIIRESP